MDKEREAPGFGARASAAPQQPSWHQPTPGSRQPGGTAPAAAAPADGKDDFRLDAPAIGLPKGGGAIKSIDEEFAVSPSTGTASLGLALPLTAARNGAKPPLRLRHDSGSGNGVFGLGWSLDLLSVRRRTDKAIPAYDDGDTFSLGGAELVPVLRWDGAAWAPHVDHADGLTITRYRPRAEGEFSRIERVDDGAETWWRVTTRDNLTTFLGTDDGSRLADPADGTRVFEWLPRAAFDDQGNCVVYSYAAENLDGVADSLAEANRHRGLAPVANRYLKRVQYGNRAPYAADPAHPHRLAALPAQFLFELVFDFGDHDPADPAPDPVAGAVWPARPDPFSVYRSGFEVRTYRLVRRVLMFHRFDELDGGRPTVVRSLDLAHEAASSAAGAGPAEAVYLTAATQTGWLRHDGVYATASLPPVQFEYEPLRWNSEVRRVAGAHAAGAPVGANPPYQWADLLGEGIAGLFSEQAGAWFYTANLGDPDDDGGASLDVARLVRPKPSLSGLGSGALQLQDLDADGRKQVVAQAPGLRGFYELEAAPDGAGPDTAGWQPFRPIPESVRIELDSRHLRMLDLVGDGRAHILVLTQDEAVWHRSRGKRGYEPARRVVQPADEERGPLAVFADGSQTIFLADMSGDGLVDIARIRNGEVCYWPNLGYGRFGAKVAMDGAPVFDHPDQYRPDNVHLADVSGTGAADIVYQGRDACTVYLNLSGNAWASGRRIAAPFPASSQVRLTTTDLLGNGTACLVWSSSLPADAAAPMRYVDLMGGRKPHLLTRYANGLGKQVALEYRSSTWHYLRDKAAGRPWATRLAFPVHCVRRAEVRDSVSGARLVTEYRYRHGHYDTAERTFAGFGMVEQVDAEHFDHWGRGAGGQAVDRTVDQAPVVTRTWFHTGADNERPEILTRFRSEYWDAEFRRVDPAAPAPAAEPALADARLVAAPGIDPAAVDRPDPELRRQALWACRGLVLRKEVFALDAPLVGATPAELRRQATPYTVQSKTCLVQLLQPPRPGAPASFAVQDSESLSIAYERDPADPRIEHTLNVRVDEVGGVLESATVRYGRAAPEPSLPEAARREQARTWISYQHNAFTADAVDAVHHRLRRPSRASQYEVRGLSKNGPLYRVGDFDRPGFNVLAHSVERPHHDREADPPPGQVWRRLTSRKDTLFYDGAAAAPLALHALHFRALPYESYELAFPDDLLAHVYGGRATDAVMAEGGYARRENGWWVASGRMEYTGPGGGGPEARFFTPVAHVDGLGARTQVRYLAGYHLLQSEVEDAAGNLNRAAAFDFRTLSPVRVVDPNDNVSEAVLDELGRVKASAVRGKGAEGDDLAGITGWTTPAEAAQLAAFAAAAASSALVDAGRALLGRATARFVYDLSGPPASAATIVREQHAAVDVNAPVHVSFEYSNGTGAVEMSKVPAEPGPAKQATVAADGTVAVAVVDTSALAPPQLRWLGTGRKVLNNKGNAVKEYEPFFSTSHRFETERDLVESGVTQVHFYDPLGRRSGTDYPEGTLSRTVQGPWRVEEHDRNDTVLRSAWYDGRVRRLLDAALTAAGQDPAREADAAHRCEPHADTPFTRHLNALGRPVADVQHNGRDGGGNPVLFTTVARSDVSGRTIAVTDPRGVQTVSYLHDLRGALAAYTSADSGHRLLLANAAGEPLRLWDDRGHEFSFSYDDPLHRCTAKRVTGGDGPAPLDHVFERTVWGEGRPGDKAANLRGRVALQYDTAGRVENRAFDFKGNLLSSARRFAADYRAVPHWAGAAPDGGLEAEVFASSATYDGLDRVASRTTADGSVYRPTYNPAGLLETVRVEQAGTTTVVLKAVDYDEQGRRRRAVYGNDVETTYVYDPRTFRLVRVTARAAGGALLQDLHHTYDASGNLVLREDRAIPTVFFDNAVVTGLATYRYDPLYRLVEATGREHAGQAGFGAADNWRDEGFRAGVAPGDALAWRTYTETYGYDEVGNFTTVDHDAANGDWTRTYHVAADSNRLVSTEVGATAYAYHYNAHGCLDGMPHLSLMRWNFRDELQAAAAQAVAPGGTPETTWFVYDAAGKRVRKVTDRANGTRLTERVYLDGVELHRQYDGAGAPAGERQTLDVQDDRQCVAHLERDKGAPGAPLVRYQTENHQSSATLETDETGRVVSYEEYHPFGTTAYQAVDRTVRMAAKRYRYTGMERDEETGFGYHGARYYVPWLGRWTAPDTHPDKLDGNRYAFVKNNPVAFTDPNGQFEEPVHGALTYRLALAAGFTQQEAARIAIATAGVDHNILTRPGDSVPGMAAQILVGNTQYYHYPSQLEAFRRFNEATGVLQRGGATDENLEQFGRALHSLQDVGFRDAPGPHNRAPHHGLTTDVLSIITIPAAIVGGMLLGLSSITSGGLSTGLKVAGGILLGVAAFALLFALLAIGVGHPDYDTERHLAQSTSGAPVLAQSSTYRRHAADHAFADPEANRRELTRIFDLLVTARQGLRPNGPIDRAGAEAAIQQAVTADNEEAITKFLTEPVQINGQTFPSYEAVRDTAPWADRPPDVSLDHDDPYCPPRRSWQTSEACRR